MNQKVYQVNVLTNIVNKHMFVTAFGQSLANELYEKELGKDRMFRTNVVVCE